MKRLIAIRSGDGGISFSSKRTTTEVVFGNGWQERSLRDWYTVYSCLLLLIHKSGTQGFNFSCDALTIKTELHPPPDLMTMNHCKVDCQSAASVLMGSRCVPQHRPTTETRLWAKWGGVKGGLNASLTLCIAVLIDMSTQSFIYI